MGCFGVYILWTGATFVDTPMRIRIMVRAGSGRCIRAAMRTSPASVAHNDRSTPRDDPSEDNNLSLGF